VTDQKSIPLTPGPTRPIALKVKISPIIPSDLSDRVMKTWGILTGQCKGSPQIPAEDSYQSSIQLNDNKLIFIWYADSKINIWDTEKGEPLQKINVPNAIIKDLRVSGDGSKVFCQYWRFIQAWDIWTGETVGKVEFEQDLKKILVIDGSKVWVDIQVRTPTFGHFYRKTQGWDFGILGSSPIQISNKLPNELHLNDTKLWETSMSRMKDIVTGKVVFQLPEKFGKPVHVQLGGQYLVIHFPSQEVLILDFGHMSPW